MQPAASVSVLFLFQSMFLADVSGNFKYGMSAKCTVRMGTADMRSTNWLEENPCSFSLALISASVQSVRPAEGVWARDMGFQRQRDHVSI